MNNRLTKADIEYKLHNAELENFTLKSKLEEIENISYLKENTSRAEGYRQAIVDVMLLLEKIFGKDEAR